MLRRTEEAMNLLGEWTPDVLVSDIEPGEDGYSLIRRIRASEANRGTRMSAVALTAHARVDDRMRTALSAGYDAHLAKPVEPAELIMVITSHLSFGKRKWIDWRRRTVVRRFKKRDSKHHEEQSAQSCFGCY